MRIPTLLAMEWTDMIAPTIVSVVTGVLGYFVARRRNNADIRAIETTTDLSLADRFLALLNDVQKAKLDAVTAEERHSLDRIATSQQIAILKQQVENCKYEHEEWAACKNNMLSFLISAEPALQAFTSQPNLLAAVASLKDQIESMPPDAIHSSHA